MSGVGQFAPEIGYWLNSGLMLSVQIRYEYITGTTDIYETTPMKCPNGICKTANYAFAGSARRPGSSWRASSTRSSRWPRAWAPSGTS
jgi:hypothetical protein